MLHVIGSGGDTWSVTATAFGYSQLYFWSPCTFLSISAFLGNAVTFTYLPKILCWGGSFTLPSLSAASFFEEGYILEHEYPLAHESC